MSTAMIRRRRRVRRRRVRRRRRRRGKERRRLVGDKFSLGSRIFFFQWFQRKNSSRYM